MCMGGVKITATPGSALILTPATVGRVGHPTHERRHDHWAKARRYVGHAGVNARRLIILDTERSSPRSRCQAKFTGREEDRLVNHGGHGDRMKGGLTLNCGNPTDGRGRPLRRVWAKTSSAIRNQWLGHPPGVPASPG